MHLPASGILHSVLLTLVSELLFPSDLKWVLMPLNHWYEYYLDCIDKTHFKQEANSNFEVIIWSQKSQKTFVCLFYIFCPLDSTPGRARATQLWLMSNEECFLVQRFDPAKSYEEKEKEDSPSFIDTIGFFVAKFTKHSC